MADINENKTNEELINNFEKHGPVEILEIIPKLPEYNQIVLISLLPPYKAAVIIENLPEEMQESIVKGFSKEILISEAQLSSYVDDFEKRLAVEKELKIRKLGGIQYEVELLNFLDRKTEKKILKDFSEKEPELYKQIKKRMFGFEDIVMQDDAGIKKILKNVEPSILARALQGCEQSVIEKITQNLTPEEYACIQDTMKTLGNVNEHDVEESRNYIISVIRRLSDCGEIIIKKRHP